MTGVMLVVVGLTVSDAVVACCRNYQEFADVCRAQGGIPSPNPPTCSPKSSPSYSPPARDYEAERRQQAEAAAAAERERQAEARRVKEEAEKQAAFIRSRDDAASTLKGSTGNTALKSGGLKGSGDYGLKDAVNDHGLKGSTTSRAEPSKQVVAWKQLHCAASIARYALSALQTNEDHAEFSLLQAEALKALDGKRPGVECASAPPFPDARGKAVDMERVKAAERQVLERAASIADRMKQRQAGAQPVPIAAPTGPETPDEKMRRVQKELNSVNSRKIDGKTQREIDQQEKDRKELAKLVLMNNGLEKGDFTSVGVSLEEVPRKPRAQRQPPPAPSTKR